MERSPKYSLLEAKQKIEAFCAYQERCDQEVRLKLQSWLMHSEDVDILISDLITNNFLNEERFAEAFVSGKFRIKKWGRIKIKQHLKQKKISDYSIKKAMAQIDPDVYYNTLVELAENKSVTGKSEWDRKAKLKRYLASKGYENDLINEVVI
ncbi:MAG: RecX family transcriptional regulator [Crocinitomicaceae bacterium]|nr:RecX family transcriptional regulator [Crocinitomicaceae bacterium]